MFFQLTAWSHPRIRVNNEDPVESEVVINAGSRLYLTCEGDGPVTIVPRVPRFKSSCIANGSKCTITTEKAIVKFTGTYKCVYIGKESSNFSSVHIFVRGEYKVYAWT